MKKNQNSVNGRHFKLYPEFIFLVCVHKENKTVLCMEFFSLTGDEGSCGICPLSKLDCLQTKKKMFSAEKSQVLNQLLGLANTEPSTYVLYVLCDQSTLTFSTFDCFFSEIVDR